MIVLIAYPVVRWEAGIVTKFAAVLVVSTVLTFALYELVVRRARPVRFLFGVKPREPAAADAGSR